MLPPIWLLQFAVVIVSDCNIYGQYGKRDELQKTLFRVGTWAKPFQSDRSCVTSYFSHQRYALHLFRHTYHVVYIVMNWTGGRLNFHAKSTHNSELKTQKRYFANAQLQTHKQQQKNNTALYRQEFVEQFEGRENIDRSSQFDGLERSPGRKSRYFGKCWNFA